MNLNSSERKCLKLLVDAAAFPESCILFYSYISEQTNLSLLQVRRAIRSLARKGLAEHKTAWSDEGLAGSGYSTTAKGLSK